MEWLECMRVLMLGDESYDCKVSLSGHHGSIRKNVSEVL